MSFLSSNHSIKRENAVKEAILNCLDENAREIHFEVQQQQQQQQQCGDDCLQVSEATTSLCTTLEAIFLHGLKDSIFLHTINIIVGDEERRPEPSFWPPVMLFLHKQVIEQIQSLTQITSDIGQCRAWIRLSLNESVLSSYLSNMSKNGSALSPYYKKNALIKDSSRLEAAVKILADIEAQSIFSLPTNSSLLNHWSDYTLQLSGLWSPPLKTCPVNSGVDIAGSMPVVTASIPTPQPLRTNELFSESISNSPFSRTFNFAVEDLNQHENLERFLQKVDEISTIDEEEVEAIDVLKESEKNRSTKSLNLKQKQNKSKKKRKKSYELNQTEKIDNIENDDGSNNIVIPANGNSLTTLMQTSWSSDLSTCTLNHHCNTPNDDVVHDRSFQRSISMTSSVSSLFVERCSYNTLLRKHERNRAVDWTDVWENFLVHNAGIALGTTESPDVTAEDLEQCLDDSLRNFEEKYDMVELHHMVEQLCKLAREPGLNSQGFLCKSCQHPLGIGYSHFRVCAFSGNYYCGNCMDAEPVLIPAQIIFNWNFRKYAISKRAAAFLNEFRNQSFIDLKFLNPDIYEATETMAEIQSLRIRLNFIRAYLYTCGSSCLAQLKSELLNKTYLYEHIHQYSISDLAMIQRGTLCQLLQKAYKMGETHVLKCSLCSVKGFICEICKSPRVLYPFHIETTFKCASCGAVFHANCLNDQQPCPKCDRKRKRDQTPIIEADFRWNLHYSLDSFEPLCFISASNNSSTFSAQPQDNVTPLPPCP